MNITTILQSALFIMFSQGVFVQAQTIDVAPPPPVEQVDEVFTIVEQMPSFGDGEQSELIKFISEHIIYPPSAMEDKIEGVVYIRFIVEEDGSLSDYKILRNVSGTDELSREAIRVIKLTSGMWRPGMQGGKPVRVYYNLPVRFKLL